MNAAPETYTSRRAALHYSEIAYGVGGISLPSVDELDAEQLGYSVDATGQSLVGEAAGDWSADWLVIGKELACGDPMFLSLTPPHAVFMAADGQGVWEPKLVAPSVDAFWSCLERFRQFAVGRDGPGALKENPPDDYEIRSYLADILTLCGPDHVVAAVEFWAIQAEIGMDDDGWESRLERLLATGQMD